MCTAITYQPRELYMGRSLDYEASYGEEIVMLPRRFPLRFRHGGGSEQGYAILGTAHVADGYPLYYDAVNEKGLGIAGLNFVGNAHYAAPQDGRQNVAQFEFIPWLLRQCATLTEARQLLQAVNLTGTPFSPHCGLMYPQDAAKAVSSFLLLYFSIGPMETRPVTHRASGGARLRYIPATAAL